MESENTNTDVCLTRWSLALIIILSSVVPLILSFLVHQKNRILRKRHQSAKISAFQPSFVKMTMLSSKLPHGNTSATRKWSMGRLFRGSTLIHNIDVNEVEMREKVAEGSFSVVYKGYWQGFEVAIKRLRIVDPAYIAGFEREVTLLSQMRHPNILTFIGAHLSEDLCMHVTEYMSNGTLYDFLRNKENNMSWNIMLDFSIDAARGMVYLHGRDVVQRDVKSQNLLVDGKLNVKLSDFGLSRAMKPTHSRPMTHCGTPMWAAPEIIKHKPYSKKADVYSFGIVLFEIVAREDPYKGIPSIQVPVLVGDDKLRPTVPSFCPEPFEKLMKKCWAQEPNERPDFSEILETLFEMKISLGDPELRPIRGSWCPPPQPLKESSSVKIEEIETSSSARPESNVLPKIHSTADYDTFYPVQSQHSSKISNDVEEKTLETCYTAKDIRKNKTTHNSIHPSGLIFSHTHEAQPVICPDGARIASSQSLNYLGQRSTSSRESSDSTHAISKIDVRILGNSSNSFPCAHEYLTPTSMLDLQHRSPSQSRRTISRVDHTKRSNHRRYSLPQSIVPK